MIKYLAYGSFVPKEIKELFKNDRYNKMYNIIESKGVKSIFSCGNSQIGNINFSRNSNILLKNNNKFRTSCSQKDIIRKKTIKEEYKSSPKKPIKITKKNNNAKKY